jgi:hypothetical protein
MAKKSKDKMRPKNGLPKTAGIFVSLLGFLLIALQFPTPAESQPAKLESRARQSLNPQSWNPVSKKL